MTELLQLQELLVTGMNTDSVLCLANAVAWLDPFWDDFTDEDDDYAGDGGLDLVGEVGVESVGAEEPGAGVFVAEEFVALFIAFADAGDVAGEGTRRGVLGVEIFGERGAIPAFLHEKIVRCRKRLGAGGKLIEKAFNRA